MSTSELKPVEQSEWAVVVVGASDFKVTINYSPKHSPLPSQDGGIVNHS